MQEYTEFVVSIRSLPEGVDPEFLKTKVQYALDLHMRDLAPRVYDKGEDVV